MAGINAEGEVVSDLVADRAINIPLFIRFLKQLVQRYGGEPITCYWDNLAIHHSKVVRSFCQENRIRIIFGPIYDSPVNPIEYLFKLSKHSFRKRIVDYKQKTLP